MIEEVQVLFTPAAQIALIIGLAEIAKKIGMPHKFIPLLDVVLGLILGTLVFGVGYDYGVLKGVVIGISIGLSACGMYSGVKNVIRKDEDDDHHEEE